ncbi:MAG: nucleotide disphospho-sugar-binding domain-containing protein [Methylocystis sp.]
MHAALPKILLVTFGSLGDVYPFIALGQALQREGFVVVVATSESYRDLIVEEGLGFTAIHPDLGEATERLGMDLGEIARRMSVDDGFLFQKLIFPFLHEAYGQLYAASEGAVAVVAHSIAFAAHAVAEKRGLPLFVVTLSPVMLYSAYDPPQGTRAPFIAAPRRPLALAYNRALLRGFAWALALWAAPLAKFRREVGLPRRGGFDFFAGAAPGVKTIALHSKLLAPPRPDHSPDILIAGQTFYDRGPQPVEREARALEEFLASGPPPVVFTLGSFVARSGGDFYRACMAAATDLGLRAVVLAHGGDLAPLRENAPAGTFVAAYVPHAELFPRACLVVHHGGVGTSAQALRAGKPQLVTPFLADQPDNAARLVRLGLARSLDGRTITAATVSRELRALLEAPDYARLAREAAGVIAKEDGAAVAARGIGAVVRGR